LVFFGFKPSNLESFSISTIHSHANLVGTAEAPFSIIKNPFVVLENLQHPIGLEPQNKFFAIAP
jgi:hypothetical protein